MSKLKSIFRQAIFEAIHNTDEQALEVQILYPDWELLDEGTKLFVGDRVNYANVLYNVITEHQKQSAWNPIDAPSLFAKVLIPEPSVIPEWEQPSSTNGYAKGDKVTHNGSTWVSLVDNNVWEPDTVGTESLWKLVE